MSPEDQVSVISNENKESDNQQSDSKGNGKIDIKNTEELIIYVYADKSVSDKEVDNRDMSQIKGIIVDMFRKNDIHIRVEVIKNKDKGDEMYNLWKNGELPINQAVLQLNKRETGEELGNTHPWFFSGTPMFEVNIKEVISSSERPIFKLASPKTEFLGYVAAHEILHNFLAAAAYTLAGAKTQSEVNQLLSLDKTGHINSQENLNKKKINMYEPISEKSKQILPPQKSLLMNFKFYINTNIEGLKSKAINDIKRYGQQ